MVKHEITRDIIKIVTEKTTIDPVTFLIEAGFNIGTISFHCGNTSGTHFFGGTGELNFLDFLAEIDDHYLGVKFHTGSPHEIDLNKVEEDLGTSVGCIEELRDEYGAQVDEEYGGMHNLPMKEHHDLTFCRIVARQIIDIAKSKPHVGLVSGPVIPT